MGSGLILRLPRFKTSGPQLPGAGRGAALDVKMGIEYPPWSPETRKHSYESAMAATPSSMDQSANQFADAKPRRSWSAKFEDAFRGLKKGIRGHSSFFVHFFFAALVCVAAFVLRCTPGEWSVLLLCIGLVLTAELFNSSIETLVRGLDKEIRDRIYPCLDIAAGAVLLASITAAIVGLIVFVNRLLVLPV
jgi:diacylglycerol kinase